MLKSRFFLIAMALALLLNADSIAIGTFLWREPSVRQMLAGNASNFQLPKEQLAAFPEQTMQAFRDQFVGLNLPIGWVINEGRGAAVSDANCQLFPGIDQAFGIAVFGSNKCIASPLSNNRTNIFLKLFGISISALVVRLGAPFCFDIWKRIRSLPAPGATSAEKEAR